MRWRILFVSVVVAFSSPSRAETPATVINAVLGDASWTSGRTGSEEERIRAHLAYVGEMLAARVVTGARGARRVTLLATLESYAARGDFPRRTDDAYAGRRPRFIDDRGVHCAVGHLIAASGQPELARQVNLRHEYGFVREMHEPALGRWAEDHGFTVDELAMIQPSYAPPPDEGDVKYQLEKQVAELSARCGGKGAHVATVALRVVSPGVGRQLKTSSKTKGPFAKCVAEVATKVGVDGHGAWGGNLPKFQFDVTLTVPPPVKVFAETFAAAAPQIDCRPRPGAIPTEVDLDVRVDKTGLHARATTRPENAEVTRCFEEQLGYAMHLFGAGAWNLHAAQKLPLSPTVTTASIETAINKHVRYSAAACQPTLQKFRVTATAALDAPDFRVAVDGGTPAFKACLRRAITAKLREEFTTRRYVERQNLEYFRLDAAATATLNIDLATPDPEEEINLD